MVRRPLSPASPFYVDEVYHPHNATSANQQSATMSCGVVQPNLRVSSVLGLVAWTSGIASAQIRAMVLTPIIKPLRACAPSFIRQSMLNVKPHP